MHSDVSWCHIQACSSWDSQFSLPNWLRLGELPRVVENLVALPIQSDSLDPSLGVGDEVRLLQISAEVDDDAAIIFLLGNFAV